MGFLDWLRNRNRKRTSERERRAAYLREKIHRFENLVRSHRGPHADVQFALSENDAQALTGTFHEVHTFFRYRLVNGNTIRIRVAPIGDTWVPEGLIIHDPED